jgi:hypothetical protein
VGGELWPAFEQVFAPEEIYFPTCLALAGYAPTAESLPAQQEKKKEQLSPQSADGSAGSTSEATTTAKVVQGQVILQALVFAQYPTTGDQRANPIPLDDLFDARFLEQRRRQGYLFLRKFKRALPEASQAMLVDPPAAAAAMPTGSSSSSKIEDQSQGHDKREGDRKRQRSKSMSPV